MKTTGAVLLACIAAVSVAFPLQEARAPHNHASWKIASLIQELEARGASQQGGLHDTPLGACPRPPPVATLPDPLPAPVQKLAAVLSDSLGETFKNSGAAAMSVKLAYHGNQAQDRSDILDASWGSTVSGSAPNADTIYAIGSITKLFTDVQLLQVQAAGLVREDSVVQESLPGLVLKPAPAYLGGPASGNITWGQLGSHTAGFPRESACPAGSCDLTTPQMLQAMADEEWGVATPPGTAVAYSNAGFALLGRGLGEVTGESWEQHVQRHIADPLEMTRTSTGPPGPDEGNFAWGKDGSGGRWPYQNLGWEAPAGGIFSTTEDLTKFAGAILRSDSALLPPTEVGRWMRRRDRVNPTFAAKIAPGSGAAYFTAWGMPWEVYTASSLHSNVTVGQWPYSLGTLEFPTKDGEVNGYSSFLLLQPELRMSFTVFMAWGPTPDTNVFQLGTALAGALSAPPIVFYARASTYSVSSQVPPAEESFLQDYVGDYVVSGVPGIGNITVSSPAPGVLVGDVPAVMTGVPQSTTLLLWQATDAYVAAPPAGDGCFTAQNGGSHTLHFVRNATTGFVSAAAVVGAGYAPGGLLVFLRA